MIINFIGGNGEMGRTYVPALKEYHEVIVTGRTSKPSIEDAAQQADLNIVCVPIPVTEEVIGKIAPDAKAIVDFTSVKVYPIEWMLRGDYNPEKQPVERTYEFMGGHPKHGKTSSLRGKNFIYCETERTRETCRKFLQTLDSLGLNVKRMSPEKHDEIIAKEMIARARLLSAFMDGLMDTGLPIQEVYALSSPPTRVLIDLSARILSKKYTDLWKEIEKFNPYTNGEKGRGLFTELNRSIVRVLTGKTSGAKIEEFFGPELERAQKSAQKLIDLVTSE